MNSRDGRNYQKGYQSGMEDIARELEERGEEAVREWLKNNYIQREVIR